MNTLTEIEKAYIAGILDGEGSISILRKKSPNRAYKYNFSLVVKIQNSYFPLMSWLKDITGIGSIWRSNGRSSHPNWKPVHIWRLWCGEARQFLLEIYPYIQIKREIINVALSLHKLQFAGKRRSDHLYRDQVELYERAKFLNLRGVVKIS